jgi:hypothetical protein
MSSPRRASSSISATINSLSIVNCQDYVHCRYGCSENCYFHESL